MFDTLTLEELYDLHTGLYLQHKALNATLVGPDHQPLISPLSDTWKVIDAKCNEIAETQAAVYAEITRREEASADV